MSKQDEMGYSDDAEAYEDFSPEEFSPDYAEDDDYLSSSIQDTEFQDSDFNPTIGARDGDNIFDDDSFISGATRETIDEDGSGLSVITWISVVLATLLLLAGGGYWAYNSLIDRGDNNDTSQSTSQETTSESSDAGEFTGLDKDKSSGDKNTQGGSDHPILPPGSSTKERQASKSPTTTPSTPSQADKDELQAAKEEISRLRRANASLTSEMESMDRPRQRVKTITKTQTKPGKDVTRTVTQTQSPRTVTRTERGDVVTETIREQVTQPQVTVTETEYQDPVTHYVRETSYVRIR